MTAATRYTKGSWKGCAKARPPICPLVINSSRSVGGALASSRAMLMASAPHVQDRSPQRLHPLALGVATALPHTRSRLRRRGARRPARGGERDQARRNRSAPAHESFTRSGAPFSSRSRRRRNRTSRGTRGPHEAPSLDRIGSRRTRAGLRARDLCDWGGGHSAPVPWRRPPPTVPRRGVSLRLDPMASGRPRLNVFLVILVLRHRWRRGPRRGKQPATAP